MLVFIGLGYSLRHLTREAIDWLEKADVIYIDTYTSLYEDSLENLRNLNPRAVFVMAKRRELEGEAIRSVVEEARYKTVAIAVPGDPFIATTHDALLSEAIKQGVEFRVVHGVSILNMAYSRVGLQSYRFGKIVTLVYPTHFKPISTIETIYDNLSRGLHTLVLLDLRIEESLAMSIPEAVQILVELDYKEALREQLSIGLARLGWRDEKICAGRLIDLAGYSYPPPPHSLIVTSRLDPVEKEIFEYWRRQC
jgi:diphthine synthase